MYYKLYVIPFKSVAPEEICVKYLSPEQVCEIIPGMTKDALAQRRFRALPPSWLKPSPRLVVYSEEAIVDWLMASERTSTKAA